MGPERPRDGGARPDGDPAAARSGARDDFIEGVRSTFARAAAELETSPALPALAGVRAGSVMRAGDDLLLVLRVNERTDELTYLRVSAEDGIGGGKLQRSSHPLDRVAEVVVDSRLPGSDDLRRFAAMDRDSKFLVMDNVRALLGGGPLGRSFALDPGAALGGEGERHPVAVHVDSASGEIVRVTVHRPSEPGIRIVALSVDVSLDPSRPLVEITGVDSYFAPDPEVLDYLFEHYDELGIGGSVYDLVDESWFEREEFPGQFAYRAEEGVDESPGSVEPSTEPEDNLSESAVECLRLSCDLANRLSRVRKFLALRAVSADLDRT